MVNQTLPPFVNSEEALLVDLVCKRYPGQKPSEYLGISDEAEAFSLDMALATRSELLDKDFLLLNINALHETINNVSRSMGAKIKQQPYKPILLGKTKEKKTSELPNLVDVLAALGGTGVVLNNK